MRKIGAATQVGDEAARVTKRSDGDTWQRIAEERAAAGCRPRAREQLWLLTSQKRLYAEFVRKTRSSERAPPRRECIWMRDLHKPRPAGRQPVLWCTSATSREERLMARSGCITPRRTWEPPKLSSDENQMDRVEYRSG